MSFVIRFHRLASRELREATNRYRGQSPRAANRFVQAIGEAVQWIADNPWQFPECERGYRWVLARKFPFVLYFQIRDEERVRILAVAHSKRRPGYWKRRSIRP